VLVGYDGWQYPKVPVKVVAWAASNKAKLTDLNPEAEGFRFDGASCPSACSRYAHKNGVYTGCAAGTKGHHDMTLTLNDRNRGGGSGQDFGQNLGAADILRELKRTDQDRMHIFLHEMVSSLT